MINLKLLVEGKYDYGCVMAKIDSESAKKILDFNYKFIGEEYLYTEDGDSSYGREVDLHTTIKYGLVNSYNEEQMKHLLRNVTPFDIQVRGLSIFENTNFDVLKFDVESPVLHQLHEQFSYLPNHDEHPEYHPHMTLAYVRKGLAERFLKTPSKFARVPVNMIVYSDRGEKTYYNL